MKRLLVMHKDPQGCPRAYAIGPANDPDLVREEAKFQLDAYQLERAVVGDPNGTVKFEREEMVLS